MRLSALDSREGTFITTTEIPEIGLEISSFNSLCVEIEMAGIPIDAAIAAGSNPCGVPKTLSKPATPLCGKVEKIPPPSLLMTNIRQLITSRVINPVKSWRKAKSPMSAKEFFRAVAIPSALEIFPSIPANPRLAKVSRPFRGVAKDQRTSKKLECPNENPMENQHQRR